MARRAEKVPMHDTVDTLRAVAQMLSELEPWMENERQVGVVCRMAAEELEQLREEVRWLREGGQL